MPLNQLHHCAIRTVKLKETRDFYVNILGMEDGDRPHFDFPGHWLYVNNQPVVHLVGIDLENPRGLTNYLGVQTLENLEGSGAIDHIAFNISMPESIRDRMQKQEISFKEREVPGMGLLQFFLKDPNGITVELNYWATDQNAQSERAVSKQETITQLEKASSTKREAMLQHARDLVPALKERAVDTEKTGRLHEDTVRELHKTGLWRICQPARINGGELDYAMLIDISIELGRGCGSTAWVFVNMAVHHWMLAMWPEAGQNEIWNNNPDTLIASSMIFPAGKAVLTEGGYSLSGRWPFCSGIDLSDWVMLGSMVSDQSENGSPKPLMVVVPKSSLEVLDTWDVVGLIGTGSKDVTCDKLFVPDFMTLGANETTGGPTPGSQINPGPLYQLPILALFPHLIAAPILGMAVGVYEQCLKFFQSRTSIYNKSKLSDHTTIHLHIAEAGVCINSAKLLLRSNCDEATQIAENGQMPTIEQKTRWRRDATYAATLSAKAANQLYRKIGGQAIYNSNPLQRHIRDLNVGMAHIGVSWDINGAEFGRVSLGLQPNNPNL